jgi:CDGSH iron-sulfur domain-containing protein 3
MSTPTIAAKAPMGVDVEAGKTVYWCSCGLSKKQPFCDGSHQGSGMTPLAYTPSESRKVFFCACKHSGKPPLCDGSHNKL